MGISGINGGSGLPDMPSSSVSLYDLDTEIDKLQKELNTPQFKQDAAQFLNDSEAWVRQGNNASMFPQFTAWVADAKTNGLQMSSNNPFLSIITGGAEGSTDPAGDLATIANVLSGG
jgi:hypothetical protein